MYLWAGRSSTDDDRPVRPPDHPSFSCTRCDARLQMRRPPADTRGSAILAAPKAVDGSRREPGMLTQEVNERLSLVGPGTPTGSLLRRYWFPIAATEGLTREPVQ